MPTEDKDKITSDLEALMADGDSITRHSELWELTLYVGGGMLEHFYAPTLAEAIAKAKEGKS